MLEIKLVIAASIICQLAAALAAIYLMRMTRHWRGWGMIAAALIFQAVRRGIEWAMAAPDRPMNLSGTAYNWAGLAISLLLFLGITELLPVFRRLRRNEDDLREANRKLLTVRENERRALASELHDSLGHRLFALQLDLERAAASSSRESLGDLLAQATRQCGSVIDDVRQICHGLYPPTLESLGLVETLRQLASEYRHMARIGVQFRDQLDRARFGREVEIACFRVAQEAITNALRHGHASVITLNLDQEEDVLLLAIEDNGLGFRPDEAAGRGLGLSTMRDRVTALGGHLRILSHPGRTQIVAIVPIRNQ